MAISILSLPRDVQIEVQSAIRDQRIIEASHHSRFFSPNGFHSDWAYADHILGTTHQSPAKPYNKRSKMSPVPVIWTDPRWSHG